MSITIMFRRCVHCGKKYSYNPSVGKFGLICPKCGKYQDQHEPETKEKSTKKLKIK